MQGARASGSGSQLCIKVGIPPESELAEGQKLTVDFSPLSADLSHRSGEWSVLLYTYRTYRRRTVKRSLAILLL